MRQTTSKRSRATNSLRAAIAGSRARRVVSAIVLVAGSVFLAATVGAYYKRPSASSLRRTNSSVAFPVGQGSGKAGRAPHNRLALQPEADRFRRRIGQRFSKPGRERTTMVGTLTLGAQQFQARIVRTQEDEDEQVDVALSGGSGSLSWNGNHGAKSGGKDANGSERSLMERIALDSPDQFILAQLRGASYYTIARNVMPAEANGSGDYNGPFWDVVRVTEGQDRDASLLLNPTRHYFLNSSTGLLEKVVSEEQGDAIVAELSGWVNQGGEIVPTRIDWKRNGQVLMQLTVTNSSTGPR